MDDTSMGFQDPTKRFLKYLRKHPDLRSRIRAPVGESVAYVGSFDSEPAFLRLLRLQLTDSKTNNFFMLPDVLRRIPAPADLFAAVGLVAPPPIRTFLDYVNFLTGEGGWAKQVPWSPDGFTIWRALSGIFVSNASGRLRLLVGDALNRGEKVFFKTEVFVLERNPDIDLFSRTAIQTIRSQMKAGVLVGKVAII